MVFFDTKHQCQLPWKHWPFKWMDLKPWSHRVWGSGSRNISFHFLNLPNLSIKHEFSSLTPLSPEIPCCFASKPPRRVFGIVGNHEGISMLGPSPRLIWIIPWPLQRMRWIKRLHYLPLRMAIPTAHQHLGRTCWTEKVVTGWNGFLIVCSTSYTTFQIMNSGNQQDMVHGVELLEFCSVSNEFVRESNAFYIFLQESKISKVFRISWCPIFFGRFPPWSWAANSANFRKFPGVGIRPFVGRAGAEGGNGFDTCQVAHFTLVSRKTKEKLWWPWDF